MSETFETGMTFKRGPGRPRKMIEDQAGDDLKERLQHWAMRLELAAALKAGCMDSESRHIEIAGQKEAIILAVAAEMRAI